MDQFGVLVESIGFKSQSRSTPLSKLKAQPGPAHQQPKPQPKPNHDHLSGAGGGNNGVDLDAFFLGASPSPFDNNAPASDDLLSGFDFDSNFHPNVISGNTATDVEDHFSIFESASSRVEKSSSENSSTIDELMAFARGTSQTNGSEVGGRISNEAITRVQENLSNMKHLGKKGSAASGGKIKVSLPGKKGAESKVTPESLLFSPTENLGGQRNDAKNTFGNEDSFGAWFSSDDSQTNSTSGPKSEIKDNVLDSLFSGRNQSNVETTSTQPSRVIKKPPSSINHVDDFLFFGEPAPSAVEFHNIEGEPEERRRARFNQHIRTKERMAKALSEKNQRDLQAQHEQQERLRSAESMDGNIKRWAAGKEGNLRALLSSLQYVLWPECGWQPVSLTDMITSVSVKKVYHKATLCVHPDKVQQKGATVQQKYIAEKVFDILKESWNKFNAEELR